uniref:Uncharacterized protein n=1 Tax=Fagus sylvatica TaxID=28930 RepID=A0A2N9FSA1_FAGSY
MLCSALSSRIFCSSSPRSVLMKPWISLLPNALLCSLLPNFLLLLSPICPHEAMDLSPPKVFPLLKFERFGV